MMNVMITDKMVEEAWAALEPKLDAWMDKREKMKDDERSERFRNIVYRSNPLDALIGRPTKFTDPVSETSKHASTEPLKSDPDLVKANLPGDFGKKRPSETSYTQGFSYSSHLVSLRLIIALLLLQTLVSVAALACVLIFHP